MITMPIARSLSIFAALLIASAPPLAAWAQDDETNDSKQPEAQPDSTEDAVGSEDAAWTVPDTFDPLRVEFSELHKNVRDSGSPLAQGDDIRILREHVTQFNEERAPTEESLAVELQLLLWGDETGDSRDALFARFETANPLHSGLRVHWARHLIEQYKYERALSVLDEVPVDLGAYPLAGVLRAEALFPINRFAESIAALDAIPPRSDQNGDLLDRIYRLRRQIDDVSEQWDKEKGIREREAEADDLPRVELVTEKGSILIELFEDQASNTVANFISLVEEGFYDGLTFGIVSPSFHIQTGDPAARADLITDPNAVAVNYTIADELSEAARPHFGGVLSMAQVAPGTGATKFLITLKPQLTRNGRNTVFGRVMEGLGVIQEIAKDDAILTARVVRKRDHDYLPERIVQPDETGDETEPGDESPAGGDDDAATDDDDDTANDDDAGDDQDADDPGGRR